MKHTIAHVALVVRDYDEAIAFYTQKLGFTLVEDTYQPEQDKRWVIVAPAGANGSSGARLLLARASTPEQARFIGNQSGGRVFLFLATDDFWRDYHRMTAAGVRFVRPPNVAPYGIVAVFEDLYGNRWDLIEYGGAAHCRGHRCDVSRPAPTVSLDQATEGDSVRLANLLELYIHDMSEVFPHVELGPDGRFGYRRLPLYWSEPDRRFAFLIRCDGRIGGFILVTRGSPITPDPAVLDVAEFFVVRQYRRAGVGRQAAFLLWDRLPGQWIVRVLETNPGALAFWRDTVANFTAGSFDESSFSGPPNEWRVFAFQSGPAAGA